MSDNNSVNPSPDNSPNNRPSNSINNPDLAAPTRNKKRCPNCRQLVEPKGDVCPECGHYLFVNEIKYDPINPKTARKIKLILGIGLLVIFGVLVYLGVFNLENCTNAT